MFQLALPAVLFKFKARGPQIDPLLQLPNRRATAQVTPIQSPIISVTKFQIDKFQFPWGNCCAPPDPLCGYADRWKEKDGTPDVPGGTTSSAVQTQSTRTTNRPRAATTEPKSDRRYPYVYPKAVTSPGDGRSLVWECRECAESRNCPEFVRVHSTYSFRIADPGILIACPGQVIAVIFADLRLSIDA